MDNTEADGADKPVQASQPAGSDAGGDEGAAKKPLAAHAPAAAGDEVDDDQVERFYALLANIRAVRRACCGTHGGGEWKKRPRGASEPPWRPAFRLEDFEVDDATAATSRRVVKRERSQTSDGEEKGDDSLPAVESAPAALSRPPARSGARRPFDGDHSESI